MSATAVGEDETQRRSYPGIRGQYGTRGWELVRELDLPANAARIAEEARALLTADVCPSLELFGATASAERFPGALRAAESVQLPVYEALSEAEVSKVARTLQRAVARTLRPKLAPSRA